MKKTTIDSDPTSDSSMTWLLEELRIFLPGAQVLATFLMILPFNNRFGLLNMFEQSIYGFSFLCAVASMFLLTAPAAYHRSISPLETVEEHAWFKRFATRLTRIATIPLALAMLLSTYLIMEMIMGNVIGILSSGLVATIPLTFWFIQPFLYKRKYRD